MRLLFQVGSICVLQKYPSKPKVFATVPRCPSASASTFASVESKMAARTSPPLAASVARTCASVYSGTPDQNKAIIGESECRSRCSSRTGSYRLFYFDVLAKMVETD
ncbi:hypothetical protein GWI33_009219 [Rhynchophorus ferrugineus]|uniref:Uncharacterized protein n=1 Tax=Rhynchophorus ferrugineus TaxID=354439 RepID=A0A834MDM8_RHYFE|nr:hypothetical protein GWI33_009219 [Rhynchophorus ferrugineus]